MSESGKYIVVKAPTYPKEWQVRWSGPSWKNDLFFYTEKEAQEQAGKLNGNLSKKKD